MNKLKILGLTLFVGIIIVSCSSIPERPWVDAVPEKAPFVIIPQENTTLNQVLKSSYTPFLDDVTASATQLLSRVDSTALNPINLNAIMLYTGANNQLETVWMVEAPAGFMERIKNTFYKDFTQNQYFFHDVEIHILHLGDRRLFATQLHNNLLISESSLGIEDAIRAYQGRMDRADLADVSIKAGHIIMNTPSLERWVRQLTKVTHRPAILNVLQGTTPTLLSVSRQGERQNSTFELSGNISLSEEIPSTLVAAFSSENAPISLDRYISSNAAAFGLFRLEPRLAPPASLPDTTRLDSVLMEDKLQYANLAETLGQEFALVMYAQSGFLTTGEHLFLRKVSDVAALRNELADLAQDDHIQRSNGTYYIQSSAIAKLFGSSFCTFQDFYLDVTGDVAVLSKRKGLVEMVSSDHNRRRTMFYEDSFRNIKDDLSEEVSGLFVTFNDFNSFIEPFLSPDNYLGVLTARFDMLSISAKANEDDQSLAFNLQTYQTRDRTVPYEEKWLFPTGSGLSGEPILANIGGSPRDEIIFATESGGVYALATDGTVVMQANTGGDTPVGSPVVYDWYGTNRNVILLAAGNKVYGWNDIGEPLPKFPFELDEQITSPLVVEDIDRNGLPDALVATANRRLHLLNGRGENLDGWPVTTNARIDTKPTVENYRGSTTVLAFSENTVHGWLADGSQRENFPKFLNASLNGSPVLYEGNILGNAADGYLYSIGPDKMFADSLNIFESNSESSDIEAIYASNNSLVGSPSVQDLTVDNDGGVFSEPMILTMSSNGSVFLINTAGQLRFTQNMGQPAASKFSPFLTDINQDNQKDIIGLANFGRLYVWEVRSGERIYAVPTSAMEYPVVADIDNDGFKELIAQTNQGLRTWTIYDQSDQSTDNEE